MVKKILLILGVIVIFNMNIFADRINRKGRSFFGTDASINTYIIAIKQSPDTDLKIYAIRQLSRYSSNPKAISALLYALKLGISEVQVNSNRNQEGPVKIRSTAAFALSRTKIQINQVLIALRKTMMVDPSYNVQGNAALAMAWLGYRSKDDIKIRVVIYLKRKISRTSKNRIKLIAMIVRAFGINRHSNARMFLNIMRSRGYGSIVNREIRRALQKLR